jgi:poly(A) polymerase
VDPTAIEPVIVSPTGLDAGLLDEDAVRAVARLQDCGYEAYLVGGCVRDLLLGHRPKDFDIATSARPAGVKRTFPRNCRIIGRRFKLAHLHFHGNTKILEVSTFRRPPEPGGETESGPDADEDLLITRDNEFGTAAEDALRRDFTINALFYDPIRDELLDHTDGLHDIEHRTVRTIGTPLVRFREDPVRILRAIKFAGRLGLQIEPETARAMAEVAPDLVRAAPPRVLEEILRLLRGGHALDAFQRLRDCGALEAMLPKVDDYLSASGREERVRFWRTLEALDGRAVRAQRDPHTPWPPENGVLLGAVFHRPVQVAAARHPNRSPTGIAEELISPFAIDFRLPRRDTGCLKRICAVQHRFHEDEGSQRYRAEAFPRDPYFAEALELYQLAAIADGRSADEIEAWLTRARRSGIRVADLCAAPEAGIVAPRGRDAARGERPDPGRAGPEGRLPHREPRGDRWGPTDRPATGRPPADRVPTPERGEQRFDAATAAEGDEDGQRKRKKRKKKRRKDREQPGAEAPRREADRAGGERAEPKAERGKKKGKRQPERVDRKRKDRDRRRDRAEEVVETIEPTALDLSAFDVELDPKRVPTFGTIVEGRTQKKRARVPTAKEVEDYRPPPPPGEDSAPPPPPRGPTGNPDTFGDW